MFKQKTKDMEELLKQLEAAQEAVDDIRSQLYNLKDGYIYVVKIQAYAADFFQVYQTPFLVHKLLEEFITGEDGILTIYTNNPEKQEWGNILSIEELKALHKEVTEMIDAL